MSKKNIQSKPDIDYFSGNISWYVIKELTCYFPEKFKILLADNIQKAFTDSKPDVIQYQKLGEDENIHLATLEDPENPLDPDSLVHPTSSLMRAAYEAIAKMDSLQKELV